MNVHRSVGLQWKVGLTQFIATVVALTLTVAGFLLFRYFNFTQSAALTLSLMLGLVAAIVGVGITFILARTIKLRLWEAGDFAARIARGDLTFRITPGPADEVGWLESRLNEMADHLETAVSDLRRLAEQNEHLAEQARRGAALEERTRLARDLHDTVNQQLFALSIGMATVRRQLVTCSVDTPGVAAELQSLEQVAREAHAQIRELILQLRPTSLQRHGLGPALQEYAQRMATEAGWTLEAELSVAVKIDEDVRDNLFRLGQEALANVRKHAQATRVIVSLMKIDGELVFTVTDDGVGFDPKQSPRLTAVGIAGMKERMQILGGTFNIQSSPGAGTTVTAIVPMLKEEGESQ